MVGDVVGAGSRTNFGNLYQPLSVGKARLNGRRNFLQTLHGVILDSQSLQILSDSLRASEFTLPHASGWHLPWRGLSASGCAPPKAGWPTQMDLPLPSAMPHCSSI